ncbi:MAG: DUF262 domain-containing protein [Bacteroidales bacterium]|nr:DUF262 domain-containing protein [Bacteroidales bacterium]
MEQKITLADRLVGEIKGHFTIPSYQRGYRWTKKEVSALLDDIYALPDMQNYCLQPIVVCSHDNGIFDLVDGQQRLTTLLIVYKYMHTFFPQIEAEFSLRYETRSDNEYFFDHIDDAAKAEQNIDFWFIHNAYKTVREWFESKGKADHLFIITNIFGKFRKQVKVIWYELRSSDRETAIALFTRLNIGRIPLTNAELVKALFLSRDKGLTREQQLEIAMHWDTIERELQDADFWYFLTCRKPDDYQTKIELIFDFIAGKKPDDREKFKTFFYFSNLGTPLLQLWDDIKCYYYRLKEWYRSDDNRHVLYHKIGYLVASRWTTVDVLMEESKTLRKSELMHLLDSKIRESVACDNYADLSYEDNKPLISRLLLLFNVMSVVQAGVGARFPFREYNDESWSLEHIHAQQSLLLNTQEKWREWLGEHLVSLREMKTDGHLETLIKDVDEAIHLETLTEAQFNTLSERITDIMTFDGEHFDVNSLSNMALLPVGVNAALKNYLFDVKRRKIREMDAQGLFIPYCTKMVFMKYYSSERMDSVTYHYWSNEDRRIYIKKMNEVLHNYLKEDIAYDGE